MTRRNKNLMSLFPHHRAAELLWCPDSPHETDLLNTYSRTLICLSPCRTNVPMHNELRTLQRNEKWKWWRNRFNTWLPKPCLWLTSLRFLIFSPKAFICWSWVLITVITERFFLLTEKSGPLRQHGAITAPLQDRDEQSFSFYRGKNFFFPSNRPLQPH